MAALAPGAAQGPQGIAALATSFGVALEVMEPLSDLAVSGT
jgi:hypothetical protein